MLESWGSKWFKHILTSCHPDSGPDPALLPQSDVKPVAEKEKDEPAPNNKTPFFHQDLKFGRS